MGDHYPWPRMTALPCRVCDAEGETERHHLVSRQRKNINHITVPLCRECHDAVHGELGLNARIVLRRKLRQRLTSEEINFIVETVGPNYLRRNYPSRVVYAARRELVAA